MIYWVSGSDPLTSSVSRQASAPRSMSLHRPWQFLRSRPMHFVLIAVLILWFIFEAVRIAYAATHPRPYLPLDSNLLFDSDVPSERGQFCLPEQARLIKVNDVAVSRREDVGRAMKLAQNGRVLMVFLTGGDYSRELTVNWQQVSSFPVFEVDSESRLVAASGLLEGDRNTTISRVNGTPVLSKEQVEGVLTNVSMRNPSILLEREAVGDTVYAYTVVDWSVQSAIYFAGLATGFCAFAVLWLRGTLSGGWAFFWFSSNLALFAIARSLPFYYRTEIEQAAYLISQLGLPFTSIVFLFNLSPLRNLADRPISIRASLLLAGLGFLPALFAFRATASYPILGLREMAWPVFAWLWFMPLGVAFALDRMGKAFIGRRVPAYVCYGAALTLSLILGGVIFLPSELVMGIVPYSIFVAWELWMLGIAIVSLGSELPLRIRHIPLSPLDRQRARMLRLASLCSFLPMMVYLLVATTSLRELVQPRLLIELSQVVFPVLLAVGIVHQNVLDLSRIVRESLLTVLLLAAGIVGYGFLWAVVLPRISGDSQIPYALYSASFTALVAVLFVIFHYLMARRTDRGALLKGPYEEDFMVRLHEVSSRAESVNEIHDHLAKEFGENFHVSSVHLVLNSQELLRTKDSTSSSREETEVWTPELEAAGEMLRRLGDASGPIFTSDLEEGSASGASTQILDALRELKTSVGIPLRDEGRLVGALLLSGKQSDQNFSIQEVRFAARVARRLGVSLTAVARRAIWPAARIVDLFPGHPDEIAGFKIKGTLGQGGTSFVYLGVKSGQAAAIKVANHSVQASPAARSRFEREAHILRELRHPNIVRLIESGLARNEPYIALEYMAKGSLKEALERQGPLEELMVARIVDQVAAALQCALSSRVIHRDVKPGNLYLDEFGELKVGDFGVGRFEEDEMFTFTGERLGTLAYLAPESVSGDTQDSKSDQYALGITAYELLVGSRPFEGRSIGAQVAAKRSNTSSLEGALATRASAGFAEILLRMLSSQPDDRFNDYEELRHRLFDLFGPSLRLSIADRSQSGTELGVSG